METIRQRLREYLQGGERSVREISQELRISERDAIGHLEHLARAKSGEMRLTLLPARCLSCGYTFNKRSRLKKPGRCPVCKGEHISGPLYTLSGKGPG